MAGVHEKCTITLPANVDTIIYFFIRNLGWAPVLKVSYLLVIWSTQSFLQFFVFANHGEMEDDCSGWEALHSVALKPNVQKIEDFNATKNRHRISDLYAAPDLSPSERKLYLSHMGHSDQVSSSIYQTPHSIGTITKDGRFLSAADRGMINPTSNVALSDLPVEDNKMTGKYQNLSR